MDGQRHGQQHGTLRIAEVLAPEIDRIWWGTMKSSKKNPR